MKIKMPLPPGSQPRRLTPIQRSKVTPFQAKVLDALLQVPDGKVATYKGISKAINCGSNQAVGQALRRNPFAPDVPCHRIVKTDLTLGGFFGSFENGHKKLKRLQDEGVVFHQDPKNGKWFVDPSCLFDEFDTYETTQVN